MYGKLIKKIIVSCSVICKIFKTNSIYKIIKDGIRIVTVLNVKNVLLKKKSKKLSLIKKISVKK